MTDTNLEKGAIRSREWLKTHSVSHSLSMPPPSIEKTVFIEQPGVKFPQYKYLKSKYSEAFCESGTLRIGTIFDFSNVLNHGARVGDEDEGARNFWDPAFDVPPAFVGISCNNAFTLCTSDILSESLADEFDADTALEIHSLEFFLEITKVLSMRSSIVSTIGPVSYLPDYVVGSHINDLLEGGIDFRRNLNCLPCIARLKDPRYQSQSETRAIWEPVSLGADFWPSGRGAVEGEFDGSHLDKDITPINRLLEPLIGQFPLARKHCTRINF